jgi:hypothetical protein
VKFHVAAPQPKYYEGRSDGFHAADDWDFALPVVMVNIYATCSCSPCLGPVEPSCRSAQTAAQNVVGQIVSRYAALPESKKEAWRNNLTLVFYNIGAPAEGGDVFANCGPGSNPTSLYSDKGGVGTVLTSWPDPNSKKPWLTPWFDHLGTASNVYGGVDRASAWINAFLDAYETRITQQSGPESVPTELLGIHPKFVAFDTEVLPFDMSQNGVLGLKLMANDARWSSTLVPGSAGVAPGTTEKTMAQLWQVFLDGLQSSGGGTLICPTSNCNIADVLAEDKSFEEPFNQNPDHDMSALRNRRIGAWYARVAQMAFNAAMKSTFYDPIRNRWGCRVYNYGDVAVEHRPNRMNDGINDEHMGFKLDRRNVSNPNSSLPDKTQWSGYSISNQRLLGVDNVYTYQLDASEAPDQLYLQPGNDALRDVAYFPEFLYDAPLRNGAFPDRWSFDTASLRNNGADLPGTDNCPVFYGRWVGGDTDIPVAPIDPNKPWIGWPSFPTNPYVGPSPHYWESGVLHMRDVLDSLFFSDQQPQQIIPWIPAVTVTTFPNDGWAGRPYTPATALDLVDILALIRAAEIKDVMVFVHDPSPVNGSALNPSIEGTPDSNTELYAEMLATYQSSKAEWEGLVEAKWRAYSPTLIDTETSMLRGADMSLAPQLIGKAISSIVPDGKSVIPSQGVHSALTWKVSSLMTQVSSGPIISDDDTTPPPPPPPSPCPSCIDASAQLALRFAFQIPSDVPTHILNESEPIIYFEASLLGTVSPGSVIAWVEVQVPPVQGAPISYEKCLPGSGDDDHATVITNNNAARQIPTGTFGFYTSDNSTRCVFHFGLSQNLTHYIDSTGKIVMRLIMKSNPLFIPVNTNSYTLSLDRFQMAIGHKYTSPFNGLTGGMLAGAGGGPAVVPSADVNHDGTLDTNDIIVFVQDFVDSSLSADLNDDGDVAVDDVIEFVQQLAP